jgi:hypothetical protein
VCVIPVGPVIHEYFNCSINAITIFPILVRGIICLHSNRPAQPLARGQHVARSTLLFYPAKTFEMRQFFYLYCGGPEVERRRNSVNFSAVY